MHTSIFAFFTGRPDISAVVFNDLLDNREPDSASALRGISGCVRSVESLKDPWQILLWNAAPVIFDFNHCRIVAIEKTKIDDTFCLIDVFDRIADNIVYDLL